MRDLSQTLASCIDTCLGRGMAFPLHLVALGANGAVVAARYTEGSAELGANVEFVAQGGGDLKLPINLMIADTTGEAARVVIEHQGARWVH